MLSLLTNYLTTTIKYIIVAVVSFLLGYGCYAYFNTTTTTTNSESKVESKSKDTEVIHETHTVTIKEKQRDTDPDLVVNNRYTASIQGETLEIPVVPHKDQTKVTTEINMTPVVRKLADAEYKRNWEVSTGLGRSHDGHFYVPIGLQKNYNYNRAIEVSVGLSKARGSSKGHIENFQVTHKWKF